MVSDRCIHEGNLVQYVGYILYTFMTRSNSKGCSLYEGGLSKGVLVLYTALARHTCMHAYMHTCTHVRVCTHAHTNTHAHAYICV